MKNIHLLPTDKPSKIGQSVFDKSLHFNPIFNYELEKERVIPQNIYFTSNEEAKEGDWGYMPFFGGDVKLVGKYFADDWKKIILTTDQDLINDGVQAIPDEFLEWFVKNPSCDFVEVERGYLGMWGFCKSSEIISKDKIHYKIIIPKEEAINCEYCGGDGVYITADSKRVECPACDKGKIPKEPKTLEEAAEELYPKTKNKVIDFANELRREGFLKCAKWQQERMYSLDEIKDAMKNGYGIKYFSEHKFLKNLNNLKNKKI